MQKTTLILLFIPLFSYAQQADQTKNKNLATISFGSCSVQEKKNQQLWEEVNQSNPDLWIWLGDNIYADTEDMQKMRNDYQLQKSHAGYQQLLKNAEVIGIWDDHDYGINDGGKEYPMKEESKAELFRFLDLSKDHPAQNRKGAYQSYTYRGDLDVKIILLDARYFRDPLKKDDKNWNIPDVSGEVLGNEQWQWLEEQFQEADIDLFILASGIQILPEDHRFEKWANFPKERTKLLQLIAAKMNKPLILLSGDRHISEVSKMDLKDYPYPLYEFTSSSLTNPWGTQRSETNRYRVKEIIYDPNFATMNIEKVNNQLKINLQYTGKSNEDLSSFEIVF